MLATTIDQSKKLLKLGLDPKTADMHYLSTILRIGKPYNTKHVPSWSLSSLLDLIPNYQLQTEDDGIGILFGCKKELKEINGNTPFDAVYNMVIWLLENNYIKSENND